MATNLEYYQTRFSNSQLKQRVVGSLIKSAAYIAANPAETVARKAFAEKVRENPLLCVDYFMVDIAENGTIAAAGDESTDNDIDYVVALFWDKYAGV